MADKTTLPPGHFLQGHFLPRGDARLSIWQPIEIWQPLGPKVLAVARTRIEGTWSAYIDAVPGASHEREWRAVLDYGTKLDEPVARSIFAEFEAVPYAK